MSWVDQELVMKETLPLDSAESSMILADYLTRILREIFNYIDDGDTIVRDRVNLCYGILQYITECVFDHYEALGSANKNNWTNCRRRIANV